MVPLTGRGTEVFYAKASAWKLNVQGVVVTFDRPHVRVREALGKAGFDTTVAWIIILKTASERRQVELDDAIDLREPGIEKLRLTPREINNGEAIQPVRGFRLLPADEAGLDQRGLTWSTLLDAGRRWLLIENMRLPAGFAAAETTIALEIPISYPMAEIDMFYCYPPVARVDGLPIPQTEVPQPIAERIFQRWSRHRGYVAPWRPGVDNVLTHLALVDASLTREVE
ncbi:E2/UBC family protein [Sphingomonas sp. Ant20]|uniref:E2/UBC family protein n=1 Tax=Sphingomonas sp. Ant20 TaxID=104605 RepID=UPI0018E3A925|nr:E2/UBC family protein [Sphingomonas sp. Ant20]